MAGLDAMDGEAVSDDFYFAVAETGEIEFDYCIYTLDCPGDQNCLVVLITQIDSKKLVCVPQAAWHRTPDRRKFPPQGLLKPALVEMTTCIAGNREEELADVMKVWVGFLAPNLEAELVMHGAEGIPDADVVFGAGPLSEHLPFAGSLLKVASEHFAFLSAESEAKVRPTAVAEHGSADLSSRVEHMEVALATLSSSMDQILEKLGTTPSAGQPPLPRPSALKKKKEKRTPTSKAAGSSSVGHVQFQGLDPSVVAAATTAGVSSKTLEQMEMLVSSSAPVARKLMERRAKSSPGPAGVLSESEEEEEQETAVQDASGSATPTSPLEKAVTQMADILSVLTSDRASRAKGSKVEAALDAVSTSTTGDGILVGSGKKAAAARRALRQALVDAPSDISSLVEKLMMEDLLSRTLASGMPEAELCARAWVEHRSRIGSFRSAAHSSWGVAGILDDLIRGRNASARARACLLLLQLDQAAVDRGSWVLAAELSLEAGPPLATLGLHQGPAVSEGEAPYSKLLDPRWAEIALAHLRETEEYVSKRRSLGAKKGALEDADPKPKPSPKAKNKGGGQQDQNKDQ